MGSRPLVRLRWSCLRRSAAVHAVRFAFLAAVWCIVPPAAALQAQDAGTERRPLVGVVRDTTGAALEGVTVAIPGLSVFTDARGRFNLYTGDIASVTVTFRLLGYEPMSVPLQTRNRIWDTLLVQMEPTPSRLASVEVRAAPTRLALGLRTFEERRKRGVGQFIVRAEIAERGAYRLSDVLRTKRGVNVVKGGKVRFTAFSGGMRGTLCQPDIWLDGVRSRGMELDDLAPNTVEAIELYPYFSTIPAEFQPVGANTTPCGTIVVWTRIPNGREP